jgi:uncharacterized BrkB/YihY/UPF0761 family membrane protein
VTSIGNLPLVVVYVPGPNPNCAKLTIFAGNVPSNIVLNVINTKLKNKNKTTLKLSVMTAVWNARGVVVGKLYHQE